MPYKNVLMKFKLPQWLKKLFHLKIPRKIVMLRSLTLPEKKVCPTDPVHGWIHRSWPIGSKNYTPNCQGPTISCATPAHPKRQPLRSTENSAPKPGLGSAGMSKKLFLGGSFAVFVGLGISPYYIVEFSSNIISKIHYPVMYTGDEDETQPYEALDASAPQPKTEVGNLHRTILKVLEVFGFPGLPKTHVLG